jgi:hypothetical protein
MTRQFRKFSIPLQTSMLAAGLLDDGRRRGAKAVRRYVADGVRTRRLAVIPSGALAPRFGGWPFLICGALAIVAVLAASFYAAHTPLSNEGCGARSTGGRFASTCATSARDRQPSPADGEARRLLPLAVALGVAPAWSAHLKRHRAAAPSVVPRHRRQRQRPCRLCDVGRRRRSRQRRGRAWRRRRGRGRRRRFGAS